MDSAWIVDYWPWILAFVAGAVTYLWRGLGVAFSGRLETTSPVFDWISCVAYALIAGLVSRMIILPIGTLQESTLEIRLAGAALAIAVFFLTRRSLLLGTFAGVALFTFLIW
ncbi:MAG: AzlD domain-containing protein [Rhodospirillales bacterium]